MEYVVGGLAGLFALYIFVMMFISMGKAIWSCFDHSHWSQDALPDAGAQVIDMDSQQVKYVKNGAKFKTTVTFSDGFTFVTHKTHRENHFGSYTISVNKMQILEAALTAHDTAVRKKLGKAAPAAMPAPAAPVLTPAEEPTRIKPRDTAPAGSDDYSTTSPLTGEQPTEIKPREKTLPTPVTAGDDYPVTSPLSGDQPTVITPREKTVPTPGDDYPTTAPVSAPRPAVVVTPAPEVSQPTRWVCPRCGLVHSRTLATCFHCGTEQKVATKFV